MKNFFLLTAALVTASTAFAQIPVNKAEKPLVKANAVAAVKVAQMGERIMPNETRKASPIQRTVADGLYYNRPAGSLYQTWDFEGYGYSNSAVFVGPWTDFTYENMSTNKEGIKWRLMMPRLNATNTAYDRYEEIDVTNEVDASGNYTTSVAGGYFTVAPTISQNESEFTLCETNTYWKGNWEQIGKNTRINTTYEMSNMSIADPHVGLYYGTSSALSTKYFWGTGTAYNQEIQKTGTCYAVRQQYEKPMTPLYIERMFINALSTSATPMEKGTTLTLYIFNTVTGNLMESINATADNIDGMRDMNATTGFSKSFNIVFEKKESTVMGPMTAPIVIDYPFMIQIEGFNTKGIDVGLYGNMIVDGDNVEHAEFLVNYGKNDNGQDLIYRHYYDDLALPLTFEGLFDGINVYESLATQNGTTVDNLNVVKVSEDGNTCQNYAFSDLDGAPVGTVTDWTDGNIDNYITAEGTPDWIRISGRYDEDLAANIVTVTCNPLPKDLKGRNALVYIEGRGVVSSTPIKVIQGDAEIPSAIENAIVDNKTVKNTMLYNLNGQRVNKNAKGILIKNGKKFINK